MRLELAADYLVMAAWLAYLKSRLLLPESESDPGPSAEDMATALALRLRRLEAIRNAADQLTGRPQLGRDVFGRGAPEPIADIKRPEWTATLYDLLTAYAQQRQKSALARVRFAPRTVWSLAEARQALERLVGATEDWGRLDEFLISYLVEPSHARDRLCVEFRGGAGNGARGAARGAADAAPSRRSSCASGRTRSRRFTSFRTRHVPRGAQESSIEECNGNGSGETSNR